MMIFVTIFVTGIYCKKLYTLLGYVGVKKFWWQNYSDEIPIGTEQVMLEKNI